MLKPAFIILISFLGTLTRATVLPGVDKTSSQDPLLTYQWGFLNQNQKVLRESDDVHSESVEIKPGLPSDIGLTYKKALAGTKKEIVIAVLDSGLDLNHPDIKNKIAINEAECDKGKLPFPAKEDRDHNGFVADCMGWNFTAEKDGNNNPIDDLGHGTHVAGILAAENDNGIGVAGFSPKIKILPLKVTSKADSNPTSGASLKITQRVLKALKYAILRHVDVVNLSLGWPANLDTPELRQVFADVRAAGIAVVAAAGNNNQAGPVFPCAYEGVLCVGATALDRGVAEFSNYGGFVDILAPGEQILSLFPTTMTAMGFSVNGYDVKNGTSQAAPYVAGVVGLLKGTFPEITENEIRARLFATSVPATLGRKFFNFGLVQADAALQTASRIVIEPVFKNLYRVNYRIQGASGSFQFSLPFTNLWLAAPAVTVQVRSLSPQFHLDTEEFNLGRLAPSEKKSIALSGQITDLNSDRQIFIEVMIKSGAETLGTFKHQFVLSRELAQDGAVQNTPVVSAPRAQLPLLTVNTFLGSGARPDYYFSEKNDKGTLIHLFKWVNGSYVESQPYLFAGVSQLLSLMKVDQDYWLSGVATDEKKTKFIQTTYLDENFVPRPHLENLILRPEGALLGSDVLRKLSFLSKTEINQKIPLPVFVGTGTRPKLDQNPDRLEFETNTSMRHIYFYEPFAEAGRIQLRTRLFDNYRFDASLRARLQIPFAAQIRVLQIMPQGAEDHARGVFKILVGYGRQQPLSYVLLSVNSAQVLNHEFTIERQWHMAEDLQNNNLDAVLDVRGGVLNERGGASFTGFFTQVSARSLLMNPAAENTFAFQTLSSRRQDTLLGLIQTFTDEDSAYAFFQSKSNLILVRQAKAGPTRDEASIQRSSLLPGAVFNEVFFPLVRSTPRKINPAIYVDATQLSPQQIYTWVADEGRLIAPINLSVTVPNGCRALAPQRWGSDSVYAYQFLCRTGDKGAEKWSILSLPVTDAN